MCLTHYNSPKQNRGYIPALVVPTYDTCRRWSLAAWVRPPPWTPRTLLRKNREGRGRGRRKKFNLKKRKILQYFNFLLKDATKTQNDGRFKSQISWTARIPCRRLRVETSTAKEASRRAKATWRIDTSLFSRATRSSISFLSSSKRCFWFWIFCLWTVID